MFRMLLSKQGDFFVNPVVYLGKDVSNGALFLTNGHTYERDFVNRILSGAEDKDIEKDMKKVVVTNYGIISAVQWIEGIESFYKIPEGVYIDIVLKTTMLNEIFINPTSGYSYSKNTYFNLIENNLDDPITRSAIDDKTMYRNITLEAFIKSIETCIQIFYKSIADDNPAEMDNLIKEIPNLLQRPCGKSIDDPNTMDFLTLLVKCKKSKLLSHYFPQCSREKQLSTLIQYCMEIFDGVEITKNKLNLNPVTLNKIFETTDKYKRMRHLFSCLAQKDLKVILQDKNISFEMHVVALGFYKHKRERQSVLLSPDWVGKKSDLFYKCCENLGLHETKKFLCDNSLDLFRAIFNNLYKSSGDCCFTLNYKLEKNHIIVLRKEGEILALIYKNGSDFNLYLCSDTECLDKPKKFDFSFSNQDLLLADQIKKRLKSNKIEISCLAGDGFLRVKSCATYEFYESKLESTIYFYQFGNVLKHFKREEYKIALELCNIIAGFKGHSVFTNCIRAQCSFELGDYKKVIEYGDKFLRDMRGNLRHCTRENLFNMDVFTVSCDCIISQAHLNKTLFQKPIKNLEQCYCRKVILGQYDCMKADMLPYTIFGTFNENLKTMKDLIVNYHDYLVACYNFEKLKIIDCLNKAISACKTYWEKIGHDVFIENVWSSIIGDEDLIFDKRCKLTEDVIEHFKADNNYLLYGKTLFVLKRYQEAGVFFNKAIEIDPEQKQAIEDFLKQKHTASLKMLKKELSDAKSTNSESACFTLLAEFYEMMYIFVDKKYCITALNLYKEIERKYDFSVCPGVHAKLCCKIADMSYFCKFTDRAEYFYEKAMKVHDSGHTNIFYKIGCIFYDEKNFSKAAKYFAKAADGGWNEQEFFRIYGIAAFNIKDYDCAIECFVKLEDSAEKFIYMAKTYHNMKKYDFAFKFCNIALSRITSEDSEEADKIYYMRGISLYELKRYSEAREDFNRTTQPLQFTKHSVFMACRKLGITLFHSESSREGNERGEYENHQDYHRINIS